MPESCDGDDASPTWQVTAAADATSTTLSFDGAHVALREYAVTATIGHFATPRLGWTIGGGAIVGGTIEGRPIAGGATIAAALSWLPVYERARRPFVGVSASLAAAYARATADDGAQHAFSPWDLRGGVMVGKTFSPVVVYAAARVFGGPVFWHRNGDGVVGTDRYHVTVGAGVTVRLPARFDLAIEAMPLGEQSAAAALTMHY